MKAAWHERLDQVRSLGADETIDYRTTDYTRPAERYDWIVDVDAHHLLSRWRLAFKPGGVYCAMGGSGWWLLSLLLLQPIHKLATDKQMGLMLHWKPFHPPDVAELERLVAAGAARPVIDRRYSLDEVADALAYVNDGRARGKVLIYGVRSRQRADATVARCRCRA